jgi:hypothetical protein
MAKGDGTFGSCCGRETTFVYRVTSNNVTRYSKQCMVCGDFSSNQVRTVNAKCHMMINRYEPIPLNLALSEGFKTRERETKREAFTLWREFMMDTPEWRKARRTVYRRARGVCEVPGCWTAGKDTHHDEYHKADAFYDPQYLRLLCRGCHNDYHGR